MTARSRTAGILALCGTAGGQNGDGGLTCDADRIRATWRRLIKKLKQFRRIATRYEKRAANYLAVITIVVTLLRL